jgi:acetyl-CoA carboxylase biotin carboxyl carrier protein
MTIEEIKELIQLVRDTGIAELEVQRGDHRVRIRLNALTPNQEVFTVTPASNSLAPAASIPPASKTLISAPTVPQAEEENTISVKSPIVGTYYDAPGPGAPPFVKVGDAVEPRQVLCIIESMKLMNEIEAEVAGTIAAKLVESGRPVEYGETLFTIRPR